MFVKQHALLYIHGAVPAAFEFKAQGLFKFQRDGFVALYFFVKRFLPHRLMTEAQLYLVAEIKRLVRRRNGNIPAPEILEQLFDARGFLRQLLVVRQVQHGAAAALFEMLAEFRH